MRYYGVQNEVKSYLNRLQSEEGIEVSLGTVKTLNNRVEALKKSGVWSQYGLGFNDGDADRYFQRATVRDAIGRFEVCLFVRGMKTLGLWQNMVSWPMRSYQNAGTGSTVYSLGGLGVYDGSMVNSPTWSNNGLRNTAGLYAHVNANGLNSVIRSMNSYSSIAVAEVASGLGNDGRALFCILRGGEQNGAHDNALDVSIYYNFFQQFQSYLTGGTQSRTFGTTGFNIAGYTFLAGNRGNIADPVNSLGSIITNGSENSTLAGTGVLPSTNPYGQNFTPVGVIQTGGTVSFVSMVTPQTPTNIQQIRNLYKLTLGSSLALP